MFEDVRKYALERIDRSLDDAAQQAARKAIDDALYGLMMVIDGVTGALANGDHAVTLTTEVRLVRREGAAEEVVNQLDLRDGDGMCMGHHGWIAGDFGSDVVAVKKVR